MDKKQRVILIALIILVMGAALVSAFSISLFHKTPAVVLPSLPPEVSAPPQSSDQPQGSYQRLEVDTTTVQRVIATLDRPESYARTVIVDTLGADGSYGTLTANVVTDGGWTRVEATLPDGRVSHSIVGEGRRCLWYDNELTYKEYEADDTTADLAQHLPSYEDVLAADADQIASAGYETQNGLPCIYVAVNVPELDYREHYWVSVDTGLLVFAATEHDGQVVYRMSGYTVETPAAPGLSFSLPDGTVLHTTDHPD